MEDERKKEVFRNLEDLDPEKWKSYYEFKKKYGYENIKPLRSVEETKREWAVGWAVAIVGTSLIVGIAFLFQWLLPGLVGCLVALAITIGTLMFITYRFRT